MCGHAIVKSGWLIGCTRTRARRSAMPAQAGKSQEIAIMRILFRQVLRNRDGNALIETAITLPILIVVMSGIIDFGYMFAISNSMQSVSNETARLVAINRITPAEAPAYAQSRLMKAIGTYQVNTSATGTDVTVAITLPRRDAVLVNVTGLFSNGNLNASSTMRVISTES